MKLLIKKRQRQLEPSEADAEWYCLSKQQWTDEFKKLDVADRKLICETVSAVNSSDLIPVCNQLNPKSRSLTLNNISY